MKGMLDGEMEDRAKSRSCGSGGGERKVEGERRSNRGKGIKGDCRI